MLLKLNQLYPIHFSYATGTEFKIVMYISHITSVKQNKVTYVTWIKILIYFMSTMDVEKKDFLNTD